MTCNFDKNLRFLMQNNKSMKENVYFTMKQLFDTLLNSFSDIIKVEMKRMNMHQ